jgi:PKHD-type hydroxylase
LKELHAYNDSFVTKEDCDKIIEICNRFTLSPASINYSTEEPEKNDPELRRSEVAFISDNWLNDYIGGILTRCNEDIFNVDIVDFEIQYTVYKEENEGFYCLHQDVMSPSARPPSRKSFARKLSMTIQLTDPNDYDGGDFSFIEDQPQIPKNDARKRGAVIVFPSFIYHRVSPVTRGERKSLVVWASGPDWR